MPPKRQRNKTTINNLPENVLEQIHRHAGKRSIRNSVALEAAFKRARRAVPLTRPNRITGPKKLEYPPEYPLPGDAEVRELKQRLLFITKLLRALQKDAKNAKYKTRLERYTAFKNTLQHIMETNRSFDTITRHHIRTYYASGDDYITSLRNYREDENEEDPVFEDIDLRIESSRHVIPFTVKLDVYCDDGIEKPSIMVYMGHTNDPYWVWTILSLDDGPVRLPMSIRRIRVNQQPGMLESDGFFTIRHQMDTIDIVRLITLLKKTDPNVRWDKSLNNNKYPSVRHVLTTYFPQNARNNPSRWNVYRRPNPYNSN
jgi:hypothetical protein